MSDAQHSPFAVPEEDGRNPLIVPAVVAGVFALALIGAIVVGVLLNRRSDEGPVFVTVAELRADTDRWDGRVVDLRGTVEGVRELPILSQYALYTFRDDTGTMMTLTQKGAPPSSASGELRLRAVFHSRVRLDEALKRLIEEQLGPLAGSAVGALVPGIPLNVVYLEHDSYQIEGADSDATTTTGP